MWKMIQTEWWKLRRCQILLVGIVALALCPVAQYGTQLIVNPEIRDPNFDFVHLFANVVWGNTQVFLPISLVMIGGWLIDRENTHDTMKNLLTVPVSYPKLLGGKLAATALLSLLFGLYSAAVTVLTGMLAGLPGLTPGVILQQGGQVVAAALTTFLVCMPMVLILGRCGAPIWAAPSWPFSWGTAFCSLRAGSCSRPTPSPRRWCWPDLICRRTTGLLKPPVSRWLFWAWHRSSS